VHISGIGHLLNNSDADFDPSSEFDVALVMLLCAMMVSVTLVQRSEWLLTNER
jgi:hypothetical protein